LGENDEGRVTRLDRPDMRVDKVVNPCPLAMSFALMFTYCRDAPQIKHTLCRVDAGADSCLHPLVAAQSLSRLPTLAQGVIHISQVKARVPRMSVLWRGKLPRNDIFVLAGDWYELGKGCILVNGP
jgi:hypothetical protein